MRRASRKDPLSFLKHCPPFTLTQPGELVEAPSRAFRLPRICILPVAGQPTLLLKAHEEWVNAAASQPGRPAELKAVALSRGILQQHAEKA